MFLFTFLMNEVCLKLADINITCNSTFSELYYDQISIPYQEEIKINLINDEKTILPLSSLQKYKFLTINGIGTCHVLIDD